MSIKEKSYYLFLFRDVTRYCHKILPVERAFKAEHFKMINDVEEIF